MRLGIIGEKHNFISYSMLTQAFACPGVEIAWFTEALLASNKRETLYGQTFDFGLVMKVARVMAALVRRSTPIVPEHDCKAFCETNGIPYIVPSNFNINGGLPAPMYEQPEADYVLVAGCDQLLNENGLKLAKKAVLNYHYSPLPAYRGKFVVFWQWFNKEPYIGYTFHKVDLGVDTGEIVFQGKVDYSPDETLTDVTRRVIAESSARLGDLLECLAGNKKVLLDGPLAPSYYPSKKYLELLTVTCAKSVAEVMAVFERVGRLRLSNGLAIAKIVEASENRLNDYEIAGQIISVPLRDGHIKVEPAGLPASAILRNILLPRIMKSLRNESSNSSD